MPHPPAYLALCPHTHLFPGARCRLQGVPRPEAFAAAPETIDVRLRFSDGTATAAELHTGAPTDPTLMVAAHTTAAGTSIGARAWTVRELTRRGEEVELKLGAPTRS
ncbi:hypothetical protein [Streptomyces sp. NPDC006267]|uniref:hypothetical protein n=1 Tax=Streptomyces sp. NPDC006267 TaxID=3157173 RepID=UPI0033BDA5B7